ncbi:hypothetical protein SK128_013083 [Halocaridina rubra]|uniref:Major facilitator superfamily associated domain-containing protein n=1 Tax=Halocaridina rubra TaxID=373956 RepID=A0AAN8XJ84_HALRR
MLEVFTYQIMWVAAVTFCPILAPKGLLATMTGLAGAVHYSVGRGVGALLGGYLISQYGIKTAFNFFGYVCVAGGGLYVLVYYLYLKKKIITREQEMEKEECTKNGEEGQAMLEYTKKSEIVTKDEKKKKNRHLQSNP